MERARNKASVRVSVVQKPSALPSDWQIEIVEPCVRAAAFRSFLVALKAGRLRNRLRVTSVVTTNNAASRRLRY